MKKTRGRKARLRRVAALVFALAMLCGALTRQSHAVEENPATGAITLYRWDRYSDVSRLPTRGARVQEHGRLLLSWQDNGSRYYFRMKPGKWSWTGSDTNGAFLLSDSPVSTQPLLEAALNGNNATFFTKDDMDAGFFYDGPPDNCFLYCAVDVNSDYFYPKGMADFHIFTGDGSVWEDLFGPSYNDAWSRPLAKPESTLKPIPWKMVNTYSGMEIRERTDEEHYSRLRHNANQVTASWSSWLIADFDKPYLCTVLRDIPAVAHDFSVESGVATSIGSVTYLNPGVTLTVKDGGMLTIDSLLLNDGKIVIEPGGLLILREGATVMPLSRTDENCGGIVSRGSIAVRKDAKLIGGGVTGIDLLGGSAVNFGLIASENFYAAHSRQIDNRTGGKVFAGRTLSWTKCYDAMTANIDKKAASPNMSITEKDGAMLLRSATVSVAEGFVLDRGGKATNFGSFGSAAGGSGGDVVKVFTRESGTDNWFAALTAAERDMGYSRSQPMTVTCREYLDRTGFTARARQDWLAEGGAPEGFEAYLAARLGGADMDAACTVYNAVFTVRGTQVLTVPWYQEFSVRKGGEVLSPAATPDKVEALWGGG